MSMMKNIVCVFKNQYPCNMKKKIEEKNRRKIIKSSMVVILAAVMCMTLCACENKSKNNNIDPKDESGYYKPSKVVEFDYTIENAFMDNEVFYGSFIKSGEEIEDNRMTGLVKYDFGTGEKYETDLDISEAYISSIYIDENENIVVMCEKYSEYRDENSPKESQAVNGEISDTELESELMYSEITLVYDRELALISMDETEPVNESDRDRESFTSADKVYVNGSGNLIKLMRNFHHQYIIKVEDKAGNEVNTIPLDFKPEGFVQLSNDEIIVMELSLSGKQFCMLYRVDMKEGTVEKRFAEKEELGNIQGIYAGGNDTLLINMDGSLTVCDSKTEKMTKVLNFLDSGINYNDIKLVFEANQDVYGVVFTDYESGTSEIDMLTKQSKEDIAEKEEIHLAMLLEDDKLEKKVIEFNKYHDKYKIVIDKYYEPDLSDLMASTKNYEEGLRQFNLDIATGEGADIIDLNGLKINQYTDKGLLEDLLPYMEKDEEVREEDFIQSVLNAYKKDGKIYTIPRGFWINAWAGKKSALGERISWNIDEFMKFADGLADDVELYNGVTRDTLLWMMISYNINEFVDWNVGECHFDSDQFIKMLELCNHYVSNKEYYSGYDEDDFQNEPDEITKIRTGKVELYQIHMNSIDDYALVKTIFGEEITIKGYPTSSQGNGIALLNSDAKLGINSKSKYKDVAWEFIRQFYTYEEQIKSGILPVRRDALDKLFGDVKKRKLQTASDGTQYYRSWGLGNVELYVPNPTDEDIEEIRKVIDSVDVAGDFDTQIESIISEEAESYFEGQKTAKEAADIIQSRVSVYVKENQS